MAVHARSCGSGRTRPWPCLQAAEIMTRAELPAGASTLDRLFRRSGRPPLRAAALGTLLLLRRDRDLALEALADASPLVRLAAATWLLQGTGQGLGDRDHGAGALEAVCYSQVTAG